MKKSVLYTCLLVAVAISAAFIRLSNDHKKQLETLSGTYADLEGVDWGRGTFGTRVFTFDQGKWTLLFTLALDPEMKNQVFTFRTVGTYMVQDKSSVVPNAYNALFVEDKKFVTLKNDDEQLAQGFGLAACGFTKDVEKNISESGCSLWKPVADCSTEYELLAMDDAGKLYFGLRPADNDMCSVEKRPTKLNVPVIRVK